MFSHDPSLIDPEWFVTHALASMALATIVLLLPTAAVLALMRHTISLRKFGTAHVSRAQLERMRKGHPLVRKLSHATTVLALISGGLLVQLGYMAAR